MSGPDLSLLLLQYVEIGISKNIIYVLMRIRIIGLGFTLETNGKRKLTSCTFSCYVARMFLNFGTILRRRWFKQPIV